MRRSARDRSMLSPRRFSHRRRHRDRSRALFIRTRWTHSRRAGCRPRNLRAADTRWEGGKFRADEVRGGYRRRRRHRAQRRRGDRSARRSAVADTTTPTLGQVRSDRAWDASPHSTRAESPAVRKTKVINDSTPPRAPLMRLRMPLTLLVLLLPLTLSA